MSPIVATSRFCIPTIAGSITFVFSHSFTRYKDAVAAAVGIFDAPRSRANATVVIASLID
jgi:hypothetical protein